MVSRALVLGGGGPVGIGWESGVVAGLARKGAALAEADLIVGTSAGAVVGAQLALGRPPQQLLARQVVLSQRRRPDQRPLENRQLDLNAFIEIFTRWRASGEPPEALRAEIGAFALRTKTMSEDEWLATFGQMATLDRWPERRFICTAIDAADGSFVAWDKGSGVSLIRAVASSCAVPGVFPPVTIHGRRYYDGGFRSVTNADLAHGHHVVVILAPMGRRNPLSEIASLSLEREIESLREAGSTVELIQPDEASLEAFGPNLLDVSRRRSASQAGLRQGKAEAARIHQVWG